MLLLLRIPLLLLRDEKGIHLPFPGNECLLFSDSGCEGTPRISGMIVLPRFFVQQQLPVHWHFTRDFYSVPIIIDISFRNFYYIVITMRCQSLYMSDICSLAIKFILNRQTFLSCLFLFFLSFFLSVPEPKGDYHHPPVSCTTIYKLLKTYRLHNAISVRYTEPKDFLPLGSNFIYDMKDFYTFQ